jgi:hypothetical protein
MFRFATGESLTEPTERHAGSAGEDIAEGAELRVQHAERAFAIGDHRTVQRELAELGAAGPELLERARKLGRAVSPDPALIAVLGIATVLLFAAFARYVLALGGGS